MKNKAILFILPTIILLVVFAYYPFFAAIYYSFTDWDGITTPEFIWFQNFKTLLTDKDFIKSFIVIIILMISGIIKVLTIPLLVAKMIFEIKNEKLAYSFRVFFVVPMVVPGVVGLLIWSSFFSGEGGLITQFLEVIGLDSLKHSWLGDVQTALGSLIFMGFPWVNAFAMLIFLSGYMNISNDIIDAAKVDGASGWKRFFFIELPLLRGQIKLMVVLTIIGTLQEFQTQMILTDGGPGTSTLVPGLHMYHFAFKYQQLGYASAMAVVLFFLMLGLTYINMKYIRSSPELQ